MNRVRPWVIAALLSGCWEGGPAASDGETDAAAPTPPGTMPTNTTPLDEIGGMGRDGPYLSVCRLVDLGVLGAGVFEVTALGSRVEDTPDGRMAMTYAALRRTSVWYGTPPANPVARMFGGVGGRSLTPTEVGLRVGGTYGLLLAEAGNGYVGLFAQGAYGDDGSLGGLNEHPVASNGRTLDDIGAVFAAEFAHPTRPCAEVADAGVP